MKTWLFATLIWITLMSSLAAENMAQLTGVQLLTNREVLLRVTAPAGQACRIDTSRDLVHWEPLATVLSAGQNQHTDSAAPAWPWRFYRAATDLPATNIVTGDHLTTADGMVTIHPINHASFVLTWNGKAIYVDPVGGAARFRGLPPADLVLITHSHGDHYDAPTISAVTSASTVILAPTMVFQALPSALKTIGAALTNGATTNLLNLSVDAVPAYNLTSNRHPKGQGNGYVLTVGGRRIYISGDTEDIPEMRALRDIDIAFVCMNLPFTMSVEKAASAVREFQPKVVYPYHYSESNVNLFKQQVAATPGIEVRLRKWY